MPSPKFNVPDGHFYNSSVKEKYKKIECKVKYGL